MPPILQATYYFDLPQSPKALINGNGVTYALTTYIGLDNLHTLNPPEVQLKISEPCM